jgi:hypothetical protein
MQIQTEDEVFAACSSCAEVLFLADKLCDRGTALMIASHDPERTNLERAAKELRRGGARELADAVMAIAKTAPRLRPKSFRQRYRRHLRRSAID